MDRFDVVKDIGQGNFGTAKLLRDKKTGERFAVKYIDRGPKIDENVKREIINHRSLRHPNIIRFKEVCLTPQKLAIIMEYASGGELFEHICNVGRLAEENARYFFQQLISGVSYCHDMHICHRDLKMENTLLDGSNPPRLKICDFGYSKSMLLHSQPKSTVGTPAYIAPEVLSRKEYDGQIADVWSCGVTLYVMLVGAYPFEDPEDPKNFRSIITRIMNVQYVIPDDVHISVECKHLLSRIFVTDPAKRITMSDIKSHPWFLKNLPKEMLECSERGHNHDMKNDSLQHVEDIMRIIDEAKVIGTKESNERGYPDDRNHESELESYHGEAKFSGTENSEGNWYSDEQNIESELEPYHDESEVIGTEDYKEKGCPDERNHVSELEPYKHEAKGVETNDSRELGHPNERNHAEPVSYDHERKVLGTKESKQLVNINNVPEVASNSDVAGNSKSAI